MKHINHDMARTTCPRQLGFDYVLTRGKEMVLGEVYLVFTGYNLKRTLTILGFDLLMSKIAAHLSFFVRKYLLFPNRRADAASMVSHCTYRVISSGNFARFSIS